MLKEIEVFSVDEKKPETKVDVLGIWDDGSCAMVYFQNGESYFCDDDCPADVAFWCELLKSNQLED